MSFQSIGEFLLEHLTPIRLKDALHGDIFMSCCPDVISSTHFFKEVQGKFMKSGTPPYSTILGE